MRNDAPVWCYGKDGPAFERLCPKCGRFLKMPETIEWLESADGICTFKAIECSKCGPVQANHVGWGSDFID